MSPTGGWRRWFGFAFVAVAFVFLGLVVYRNLGELRAFPWTFRPIRLVVSVCVHIGVLLWGVWVWKLVLGRIGVTVPLAGVARIWFLSSLGRYIPGKIWQFVGVAHLGSAAGVSPLPAITSLALQMGFSLLAAALTAVYLLPEPLGELGGVGLPLLRWTAPLLLLVVHPAAIRGALRIFHRVARRPVAEWAGGWGDGLLLLALSVIGWLLYGGALYLFVSSLVPLAWSHIPALAAMNALAFLIGYLVFIAPAGLGAKEGALAALLSLVVPSPVAALLAVAARLWTVAAEVVPAVVLLRDPGARAAAREEAVR